MSNHHDGRILGSILLIIGTSIGGAMLALPVANAASGFINSSLFLCLAWAVMTVGAFYLLEANFLCPPESNMVSMAKITMGTFGQVVAWVSYLLLLYTLLSGYISGGTDVLHRLLELANLNTPQWLDSILFTIGLGVIVHHGIKLVDYTNRGLMFGKIGIYIIIVALISPHIEVEKLHGGGLKYVWGTMMVLLTSFGFATIIPSLRMYLNDDIVKLRKVIIIGSTVPLACYILWDVVIMGVLPHYGTGGLVAMMQSGTSTTDLTIALQNKLQNPWITDFFRFFTSICMLTAFLSVSLALRDFLADGLRLKKEGMQGFAVINLTLLPPLLVVLFWPGIFIKALSYAGILCVIILVLLPAMMVFMERYVNKSESRYQFFGGKPMVILTILASLFLIVLGSQNLF